MTSQRQVNYQQSPIMTSHMNSSLANSNNMIARNGNILVEQQPPNMYAVNLPYASNHYANQSFSSHHYTNGRKDNKARNSYQKNLYDTPIMTVDGYPVPPSYSGSNSQRGMHKSKSQMLYTSNNAIPTQPPYGGMYLNSQAQAYQQPLPPPSNNRQSQLF